MSTKLGTPSDSRLDTSIWNFWLLLTFGGVLLSLLLPLGGLPVRGCGVRTAGVTVDAGRSTPQRHLSTAPSWMNDSPQSGQVGHGAAGPESVDESLPEPPSDSLPDSPDDAPPAPPVGSASSSLDEPPMRAHARVPLAFVFLPVAEGGSPNIVWALYVCRDRVINSTWNTELGTETPNS